MGTQLIQITAGRGPEECNWVVAQVLKYFLAEAKTSGIQAEVVHRQEGDANGTLKAATVRMSGREIPAFLQAWLGTVLWVGQSPFRKMHKRKNWFVGVFELQRNIAATVFDESQIRFEFVRAGGPGGQHVNKVSTAVRATHVPTGIVVTASNSRSQMQNRKEAIAKIQLAVQQHEAQQQVAQAQEAWSQHLQLERGNPVRIFRGRDFKANHKVKKYRESPRKKKVRRDDWED